jgi:hypothetical protein
MPSTATAPAVSLTGNDALGAQIVQLLLRDLLDRLDTLEQTTHSDEIAEAMNITTVALDEVEKLDTRG